jgi:uncharacterized damage-inducible protein DinB
MIKFSKPSPTELNSYQKTYVNLVNGDDLIAQLEKNKNETIALLSKLPKEKINYRYAEGKWSIPEIIVHIIDSERIFSYRMLCFSRGEKTSLPGYEENDYAAESEASSRSLENIIEEYSHVRNATISLLKSFSEKQYLRKGRANNNDSSVQILSYMLAGHEIHHMNVIKEKYLN